MNGRGNESKYAGEGGEGKGLSTKEKYKFGGWWRESVGLHKSLRQVVKIRADDARTSNDYRYLVRPWYKQESGENPGRLRTHRSSS
jgi:hypothetical protein